MSDSGLEYKFVIVDIDTAMISKFIRINTMISKPIMFMSGDSIVFHKQGSNDVFRYIRNNGIIHSCLDYSVVSDDNKIAYELTGHTGEKFTNEVILRSGTISGIKVSIRYSSGHKYIIYIVDSTIEGDTVSTIIVVDVITRSYKFCKFGSPTTGDIGFIFEEGYKQGMRSPRKTRNKKHRSDTSD